MMNGVAPPGDNNRWTLSPRPKPAASQIVFSSKTNAFGRKIQGWPQPQVARLQSHPPQSPSGSLSHKTLRKDKRSWTFQECGFRWKLQVKGLLKWAHSHSQQFKILRAQSSFRHWWLSGISNPFRADTLFFKTSWLSCRQYRPWQSVSRKNEIP